MKTRAELLEEGYLCKKGHSDPVQTEPSKSRAGVLGRASERRGTARPLTYALLRQEGQAEISAVGSRDRPELHAKANKRRSHTCKMSTAESRMKYIRPNNNREDETMLIKIKYHPITERPRRTMKTLALTESGELMPIRYSEKHMAWNVDDTDEAPETAIDPAAFVKGWVDQEELMWAMEFASREAEDEAQ